MLPADRKAPKVPCLNESPSQKEGKSAPASPVAAVPGASMKVPPKRKENAT